MTWFDDLAQWPATTDDGPLTTTMSGRTDRERDPTTADDC